MNSKQGKIKILFLCTGNSARSQMAEGFLKELGSDRYDVHSAGINPVGLNPLASKVMAEVGIDISKQTSDALSREMLDDIDMLITLCGDARENCPFVSVKVEKSHWPLEDPARAEGNEESKLESFRAIRDQIKEFVSELIAVS